MISAREVNEFDTSGVSRGRWFRTWPKDRIAQVYSTDGGTVIPFCPARFKLGPKDRRFGRLFGRLKYSSWGEAFRKQEVVVVQPTAVRRVVRKMKTRLVRWAVDGGIRELAFPVQISNSLVASCRAFRPDLLYSTCSGLSDAEMTLQLAEALEVPLCIQVEDDWFGALYTTGCARMLLRSRVERTVRRLISMSSKRLSIGPLMSEAYLRNYGCRFEPVYLSDDVDRFDRVPDRSPDESTDAAIVYSGSLALDRWEGILDLDDAIEQLPAGSRRVRIVVYATQVPPVAADRLASRPRIELRAGLADENVPATLKKAAVLFLPESFREKWHTYIRYSISSKAHLYMMCGRPIIVYGPRGVGVVEYARGDEWAEVVDHRDPAQLADAIVTLLTNRGRATDLVAQARTVALKNHDAGRVQEQLRQALVDCASAKIPWS